MCLIIHRELRNGRGSHVPNAVLDYNARINPDGFGIAWRESRKPGAPLKHLKFGPTEYDDFKAVLKDIDHDNDVEYVAHFRRATHGPICTRLSHPFKYENEQDGDVLVFHNGIIPIASNKKESDTSTFVDRILTHLTPRWWANNALRFLVEESIGYSRLLLMTAKETVRINESQWTKEGGIWYSTSPLPTYATGNAKGSYATFASAGKWVPATLDGDGKVLVPGHYSAVDSGKGTETPSSAPQTVLVPPVGAASTALVTIPKANADKPWFQAGHPVEAVGVSNEDSEGDTYGTAVCQVCHTIGDYYIVQGEVYLDVSHMFVDDDTESEDPDDREEEKLLAEYGMSMVN